MKKLIVLAAAATALMTSACVTVIDGDSDSDWSWHGEGAQAFDGARDECRQRGDEHSTAFVTCMADKGWVRS